MILIAYHTPFGIMLSPAVKKAKSLVIAASTIVFFIAFCISLIAVSLAYSIPVSLPMQSTALIKRFLIFGR